MKKRHKIVIAVFLVILCLIAMQYFLFEKSFKNPVLRIMTKSYDNGMVGFYEIGTRERYRSCDAFDSQECMVYSLFSLDYNNQNLETWTELDIEGNKIEKDEDPVWNDMLRQVSEKEQEHHTSAITVFETLDGVYYIQVEKNVNLWIPNVLYRYEPKRNELTYLTTLSDIEVIGLKE